MFCMTIVFGQATAWSLLFKTEEALIAAQKIYTDVGAFNMQGVPNGDVDITDDYGQRAIVRRSDIHGVMFEDMSQSKLAQIERGLHQMRTQIDANNQAKADPVLMAAMRMNQPGPGVITPFSANGAFRQ